MDGFCVAEKQLTHEKFHTKFEELMAKHPGAERYIMAAGGVYEDGERWAEYPCPLIFSVNSWTTSRVEGENIVVLVNVLYYLCTLRSSLV